MLRMKFTSNTAEIKRGIERDKRSIREKTSVDINRSMVAARDQAVKSITEIYNISPAKVAKAFSIISSTPASLAGELVLRGHPLALIGFTALQVAAGVAVDVKYNRKTIAGAFIQRMPASGYVGVFRRIGQGRAIKQLYTVSVPGMFRNPQVQQSVDRVVAATMVA